MFLLAEVSGSLLLVNLVFALVALAIGFGAGAWVCGGKGTSTPADIGSTDEAGEQNEEQQLVIERTMLASDRLRDLASSMAADVGKHSANIGAIEAQLALDRASGAANSEAVLQALAQIETANHALQAKLAKAENQIQAQAELIRTHESEARTDSLTGLANRRAFDDEIARRFAEWERKGTPFSLLILDVDHFKKFNDTHGHQAGDEVLRKVGSAIMQCAREMDLACRYGGEEFAVIMPATEGSDGGALAERVRRTVEAMSVLFEGKSLSVTASLGLAAVQGEDDVATLVKRADEALYASKDAGRNNSHYHTGEVSVPICADTCKPVRKSASPEANAELEADSLPNRTRFLELLRNEVRVVQEAGIPLALLTAEFQGHRRLETEFGESVAKLTLDSIAQFLDNALQERDRLGRYSENTFVAFLPGYTASAAQDVGHRINEALANCTVPLGDEMLCLQTVMTVTELADDDSAVTLMRRAEAAIQKAVAAGNVPCVV